MSRLWLRCLGEWKAAEYVVLRVWRAVEYVGKTIYCSIAGWHDLHPFMPCETCGIEWVSKIEREKYEMVLCYQCREKRLEADLN